MRRLADGCAASRGGRALALALGCVSGVTLSQGCLHDTCPGVALRPLDALLEGYAFDDTLPAEGDTAAAPPARAFSVRVELRPDTVALIFEDGVETAVARYRRDEDTQTGAFDFIDPYTRRW